MAQLWVDQTNAKGGLLGKKIKVISGDTKTDRVEGAKVGKDLIDQGANCCWFRPTMITARRPPCRRKRPA